MVHPNMIMQPGGGHPDATMDPNMLPPMDPRMDPRMFPQGYYGHPG